MQINPKRKKPSVKKKSEAKRTAERFPNNQERNENSPFKKRRKSYGGHAKHP